VWKNVCKAFETFKSTTGFYFVKNGVGTGSVGVKLHFTIFPSGLCLDIIQPRTVMRSGRARRRREGTARRCLRSHRHGSTPRRQACVGRGQPEKEINVVKSRQIMQKIANQSKSLKGSQCSAIRPLSIQNSLPSFRKCNPRLQHYRRSKKKTSGHEDQPPPQHRCSTAHNSAPETQVAQVAAQSRTLKTC